MRSAYDMVRSSHGNKEEMRHASEFEICNQILSVELETPAGKAFVEELNAWRQTIAANCRGLQELDPRQDHSPRSASPEPYERWFN